MAKKKLMTLKDLHKEPVPHWNDRPYCRSLDAKEDRECVKQLEMVRKIGFKKLKPILKQEAKSWIKRKKVRITKVYKRFSKELKCFNIKPYKTDKERMAYLIGFRDGFKQATKD